MLNSSKELNLSCHVFFGCTCEFTYLIKSGEHPTCKFRRFGPTSINWFTTKNSNYYWVRVSLEVGSHTWTCTRCYPCLHSENSFISKQPVSILPIIRFRVAVLWPYFKTFCIHNISEFLNVHTSTRKQWYIITCWSIYEIA